MTAAASKMGKIVGYAFLLWAVGFVWGSVVFMTPTLKELPSIPYVSQYPAISFPLLVILPFLIYFLAKDCLKTAEQKALEGIKVGATFAVASVVLDLLVVVLIFKAGFRFFAYISILLSYILLFVIPWATGRKLEHSWRSN